MRLLELFSGTQSVGRAFQELGWEVVSLDILPGATIQADILDWDYKAYPPGYFHCVHASPPCTEYSRAKTTGVRNLELADRILQRTLDVITYFDAPVFILENPYTGMMKDRPCMFLMQRYLKVVTYCSYGTLFKKSTAIWSSLDHHWSPRPVCTKANSCASMVDGRHAMTAQRAPGRVAGVRRRSADDTCSLDMLHALPAELCLELAEAATRAVVARSEASPADVSDE